MKPNRHTIFLNLILLLVSVFYSCQRNKSLERNSNVELYKNKSSAIISYNQDTLWQLVSKIDTLPDLLRVLYRDTIDTQDELYFGEMAQLEWGIKRHTFRIEGYFLTIHEVLGKIVYRELSETDATYYQDVLMENFMSDSFIPDLKHEEFITLYQKADTSVLYKWLNHQHMSIYGDSIRLNEYSKVNRTYLHKLELTVGPDAVMGEIGVEAMRLAEEKNADVLIRWLKSYHPAMKGHAYVAFLYMECKGYKIPYEVSQILEHVKTSEMCTNIRYGCTPTFQRYSLKSMINGVAVDRILMKYGCE